MISSASFRRVTTTEHGVKRVLNHLVPETWTLFLKQLQVLYNFLFSTTLICPMADVSILRTLTMADTENGFVLNTSAYKFPFSLSLSGIYVQNSKSNFFADMHVS